MEKNRSHNSKHWKILNTNSQIKEAKYFPEMQNSEG